MFDKDNNQLNESPVERVCTKSEDDIIFKDERKIGTKNSEKLKLRTDGVYVQFGYRPWNSWLGGTSDCWYNIIKVIDDNTYVLLGKFNESPFYEINDETHKPYEVKYGIGRRIYSLTSFSEVESEYLTVPNKMNLFDYYIYSHV